ncbi:MAG: thrombospondin type 3 repeat-containing protein [Anaerolineae bacterium]
MMSRHLKLIVLGWLALSVAVVSAQEACSAIVEDALLAVEDFCGELGRNQACYGNVALTAQAQPDALDFQFQSTGDVVDVADILSLEMSAFDPEVGVWGVAVMSLQADIPNTLPGQNITFILFGDVAIENASTDEQTPMQAFYLRTGIGASACEDVPESGVLIQSPDGVEEVTFNINGVDVQIGSTVFLQTEDLNEAETDLVLTTVEGSLAVQFEDESYPAIEGTQIRLPLNSELLPVGRPNLPEAYAENRIAPLPIAPLPRRITPAQPLPAERIAELRERIQNGQAPCGVAGLPSCDQILPALRSGEFLPRPERWGERFQPGVNCLPLNQLDASGESDLPLCPPPDRASRPMLPTRALANDQLPLDGDADNDGVLNQVDACPFRVGSPENSGCPQAPTDSDGDGVPDALDFCPNRAGDPTRRGCPDAPRDSDGDGFPDALDVCPNRAGSAEFRGCPSDPRDRNNPPDTAPNVPIVPDVIPTPIVQDSDGDGVPDALDACPNYSGAINGCPPDSDGDGLYDPQDQCPNQRGPAANNGCPPPDSDGDGVYDPQDNCPNRAGLAINNGCPIRNNTNNDGSNNEQTGPDLLGDFDRDGVLNGVDNCPDQAGSLDNNGCPR